MSKPENLEPLPGSGLARKAAAILALLLGLAAVGGGGALWSSGNHTRRTAGESTEVPIKLEAGRNLQMLFHTAGGHRLQVYFVLRKNQGVSDAIIDELLWGKSGPPDLTWEVVDREARLAWGNSKLAAQAGSGAPGRGALLLGEFRPPQGGTYQFNVQVRGTHAGIEAAQPALEIRTHFADAKSASRLGALYWAVGIVLVSLGAILGVVALFLSRKRT
jgi:hypothetical protein